MLFPAADVEPHVVLIEALYQWRTLLPQRIQRPLRQPRLGRTGRLGAGLGPDCSDQFVVLW